MSSCIATDQLDRICNCSQPRIPASEIEGSVVEWLEHIVKETSQESSEHHGAEMSQKIEERFDRARELYMAGELDHPSYEAEKARLSSNRKELPSLTYRAKIALLDATRAQLGAWHDLSQLQRKSLLRLVLEAGFVRENAFVAVQPTLAFSP